MTASRREMIGGGLAAVVLGGVAQAEDGAKTLELRRLPPDTTPRAEALDTPALRGNSLARSFKQPPAGLTLPKIKIERASGIRDLEPQRGLTLLSLWAPWCAPCLLELKDLAVQQHVYENKRFRILPVLTAPRGDISLVEAKAVLDKAGAGALQAAIDRSPGSRTLYETLTRRDTPTGRVYNLPCNLLIDSDGKVLGRQFGAPIKFMGGRLPPDGKPTPEMMANARTTWISPEGFALLGALQRGEIVGAAPRRFMG
jgi:hypothetical protein